MIMGTVLTTGGDAEMPSLRPSARDIRNNPNRKKTPKDLERIEAARIKRERRKRKQSKIQ